MDLLSDMSCNLVATYFRSFMTGENNEIVLPCSLLLKEAIFLTIQ